jgi:hypothetical protein
VAVVSSTVGVVSGTVGVVSNVVVGTGVAALESG